MASYAPGRWLAARATLAGDRLPNEAEVVIARVHNAAEAGDFAALRPYMASDFIWRFSGDGDADAALAEFRSHPAVMSTIARLTLGPCGRVSPDVVQCPPKPGLDYRAGFRRDNGRWRMIYFLSGQ